MKREEKREFYAHIRREKIKLTAISAVIGMLALVGLFTLGAAACEAFCRAMGY